MTQTKKFLASLVLCILVIQLVACGTPTSQENITDMNQINDTETIEQPTETESDDISFADMLPDHEMFFKNGNVTVIDSDGGTSYCISVMNITKDEYDSFVDACKTGSFSKVTFKGQEMFQARTSDEMYYVSVQYWVESETDATQNSVNITCGSVKK